MKTIILGASGMLGFQVFRSFLDQGTDVVGIVRNRYRLEQNLDKSFHHYIREIDDARDFSSLEKIIQAEKPDYLINCVGIVVQLPLAKDYHESISINALLPHQLERLGNQYGFKLIHISTDYVFNGRKGLYKESDIPNAEDLYGKTKELGEVGYGCGITLRTSLIGHEIVSPVHGLLDWFLSQDTNVFGFSQAIFSGLTTLEFSNVLIEIVRAGQLSSGIYHVASEPISKYDLLHLVAEVYKFNIRILESRELNINRSLDSEKFDSITNYCVPTWKQMITNMQRDRG